MVINKIMIKRLILIVVVFFSAIGCNTKVVNTNGNTQVVDSLTNCDTLLRGKKIISKEIPVFKIDSSFYPFLDSIIKLEKTCPYYKQCTCGFSFFTKVFSDFYKIEINSENIYTYDYSKCYGIFEYHNHRFVCEGLFNKELLIKTTSMQIVKYLNFNRNNEKIEYNDRLSTWYFNYKNKKIIPNGFHGCFIPISHEVD